MEEKLIIPVHGEVSGYRYDDETVDQAKARLFLLAEQHGNYDGRVRLHLNMVDPSLKEIFNNGIRRNDAPQDRISERGFSRYERALIFAARAHGDQKRKYSGEPYLVHPIAVAGMLKDAGLSEDVVIAGLCHDLIEDTSLVYGDIRREFGAHVADLVLAVTDVGRSSGNRGVRKAKDRDRLASASPEAQSVKCADLTSNTPSIVEHDPKFAKIYLAEKRALLAVLTRADPKLLRRAWDVLEAGEKKLAG